MTFSTLLGISMNQNPSYSQTEATNWTSTNTGCVDVIKYREVLHI